MTLEMPEGLQKFASVVVGADWPEGDEDALRRLRDAWDKGAGEVGDVLDDTMAAIRSTLETMEGETAEAFEAYGKEITEGDEAYLVALQKLCEELGNACGEVASEVEYTKISIISALAILAAQIAVMLALAVVTFGTSTAGIAAAQITTQSIVRGIVQTLLQIVQQIVINVGLTVAVDVGIQAGQMGAGDRDEWDTDKTAAAAKSGAAAGLGAGLMGGAFGGIAKGVGGIAKNSSKFMDKVPSKLTDGGGVSKGSLFGGKGLLGGAEGTTGGTTGAALNDSFQGNDSSEQTLGSGASSGVLGGVAGGPVTYKGALDGVPESTPWSESAGGNFDTAPPDLPTGSGESTPTSPGPETGNSSPPSFTDNGDPTYNPWANETSPNQPDTNPGQTSSPPPNLTDNPDLTHNPWANEPSQGQNPATDAPDSPGDRENGRGWFQGDVLDPIGEHGRQDTKDDTLKPPENWVPAPNLVNVDTSKFDTAPDTAAEPWSDK